MKVQKQETEITLTVRGVGRMWMPGAMVHTYPVEKKYLVKKDRPFRSQWPGLRDAMLGATDSGDYQGGMIRLTYAMLTVKQEIYHVNDAGKIARHETRTYYKELTPETPQIVDFWATEEECEEANDNTDWEEAA